MSMCLKTYSFDVAICKGELSIISGSLFICFLYFESCHYISYMPFETLNPAPLPSIFEGNTMVGLEHIHANAAKEKIGRKWTILHITHVYMNLLYCPFFYLLKKKTGGGEIVRESPCYHVMPDAPYLRTGFHLSFVCGFTLRVLLRSARLPRWSRVDLSDPRSLLCENE